MSQELHFMSASTLGRMIQRGEVSSRELLEHFIARVEFYNPRINAVVAKDLERARKLAQAADDAQAHGEILGPLHGLPMTIKDAYEVEGIVSTGGVPEWKNHVPQRSATAIERIQAAGGIIFGKTNVPYMSGDLQTYNDIYGTTNNPWNLACGPGGSSGGSAASLAAGLTAVEFGSDIGGSIRSPAHLCGIFGHKPTFGIVPKRGHLGPPPGTLREADLSVAGPLARSAEDLALMMKVVAGPDWGQADGWKLDLPPARARTPKELRVAVWIEDPFCELDNESAVLLKNAAKALEDAGAQVDWEARPDFTLAEITEIYLMLLHSVVGADFPDSLKEKWLAGKAKLSPDDKSHAALQMRGATISYAERAAWEERQKRVCAKWARFFQSYDVVLSPVLMRPAFPHDQQPNWHTRRIDVNAKAREYMDILIWAGPAVVSYLPASVAPVGITTDGLPVGIQIIGPHMGDHTTIAVAAMFEEISGGFTPPPGF